MLILNENLADALSDALGFAVIWFDDLEEPGNTHLRMHCAALEDKVNNQHKQFSSDDISTMRQAIHVFLDNCDEVTSDHRSICNMLYNLPDLKPVTFQYS